MSDSINCELAGLLRGFSNRDREVAILAPCAMRSRDSAGRKHPEPEHSYRGPFQRDRDRILHSSAFRRLSGKTQVFTGNMGDYHRTRLTHTMEVASIARTIGRALRLNEDLIEALALLHDIGHPPFGHAGEDALDEFLSSEGGFSHNRHALTIVEDIERPYPAFGGLNLTLEIIEGQTSRIDKSREGRAPLLEAQVVDLADSITYDAHDMDDAVKLGWLDITEMERIQLVRQGIQAATRQFGTLPGGALRRVVVHELINCQVQDALTTAVPALSGGQWTSAEEARRSGVRITASSEMLEHKKELEDFLYQRVYRHADLVQARRDAQQRLSRLAEFYVMHPEQLPRFFQRRSEHTGVRRSVVDYLAGMTDRFCLRQFESRLGKA